MYKIYQNVVLEDELPFDYSYPEMNTPFVKEYSTIFSKLDLSDIPRFTITPGKTGYDNHSMIKALIVYANEGYRSIPQLIRELKSKPYFSKYILGFKNSIPHHSTFYRFLKAFDTSIIIKLLTKVTRKIYDKSLFKFIAIDSKPVKANTKENNPKAFKKNLSDKNQKPKRNEEATLSYYSKSNDVNTNMEQVLFFWGYRIHIAVEPENDIPIMFTLKENNIKDDDVALELYSKILYAYPELYQSKLSQIADKGYYSKKVFERFHFIFDGESFIPRNIRNSKTDEDNPTIPFCDKNLKMKYHSNWYEKKQDRFRVKFVCPVDKNKCELKRTKYGCTKYVQYRDPYPGEVKQIIKRFQDVYPKRQSVERVNAFLQNLGWENPKNYSKKSIENLIGFALLAKALMHFLK